MRDSTAPFELQNSLSVESVERLTLRKIYLVDALKDQEISLANELAVIEAIDDNNDVTSWKYIVHYHLPLSYPPKYIIHLMYKIKVWIIYMYIR